MTGVLDRVAGAPISWGVCEVPGWGYQLTAERVLGDMASLGLAATEFGPDGFLPDDPGERRALLGRYGLRAVGGFVPVVLHEPDHDPLPAVRHVFGAFAAAGAGTVVLAADSGAQGYDVRVPLDALGWKTLRTNLERVKAEAAERRLVVALHPHVGTLIERRSEVESLLDATDMPLCLDTGHLLVGGTDPGELARAVPDRIVHTHLKDVDGRLAARVRAGEVTYTEAVRAGMYRPLGCGDVDIAGIVTTLEAAGYRGWYVMEQDAVLADERDAPTALADVRASVDHLRRVTR